MALALGSDLRTVIGEVARRHGYECLKEEQLSAIKKFVSGQYQQRDAAGTHVITGTKFRLLKSEMCNEAAGLDKGLDDLAYVLRTCT